MFSFARRARSSGVAALLAAALTCLLLGGCGAAGTAGSLASVTQYQQIPDRPLSAPSASLTQYDGSTWSFNRPAANKITLVYFGYTSCPDVCPLTLAELAGALKAVPASVREKIAVEFVTTDPARDTPAQLRSWLGRIDPDFAGGRAPIRTVIASARAYGIFIAAPKVTKKNYEVTHGAQVVVLDGSGAGVGYFRELTHLKSYARALPLLVEKYA